jgi:hypothetical protein
MQLQLTLNTEAVTAATATGAVKEQAQKPELTHMEPAAVPENIRDARWNTLLHEAIRQPGLLHSCYSKFHNYSIGNLMLAAWQLGARGLEFGPLATFEQWKHKHERFVRKGEKAIALWMPIQVPLKTTDPNTGEEVKTGGTRTVFVMKAQWFALSQTEGKPLAETESTPDWNLDKALKALNITLVPYDFNMVPGGNCQGYAYKRNIAISPVCQKVLATQLHEIAHVVLGHTEKTALIADGSELPRCIKELEAEATAMLCLDALGYEDMAVFNRGYIQHWMAAGKVTEVPEDSAKRIFSAADKILKAGQVKAAKVQAA